MDFKLTDDHQMINTLRYTRNKKFNGTYITKEFFNSFEKVNAASQLLCLSEKNLFKCSKRLSSKVISLRK